MCVGLSVMRVTELWMPPRVPVISEPGVLMIFSCAWYMRHMPFDTRWLTTARAVVSQRVKNGMCMMYHAQEKTINTPGSEITGVRGGIHNSVTRIVTKPTHMIGGYAQLSYGFNYYGTIGTNRDEFVVVRKMNKVDWLDTPAAPFAQATGERQ